MHQAIMEIELATDKSSYLNSESVEISVAVTDGTGPVAGVTVHAEVANAHWQTLGGDVVTGADGVAHLSYKIDTQRYGAGTYTVDATASKFGFESVYHSTAFEVADGGTNHLNHTV